jgi:HAD superfamily hydrolase (TIGR01509 family)
LKPPAITAVLLDLDGTLVDSRAAYLDAAKTAFGRFGKATFDVSCVFEIPKRLEQGRSIDDLVQRIAVDRFLDVYLRTYYDVAAVKSKPLPRVREAIGALHKRVRLGLVTMRRVSGESVSRELEGFGLRRFFDCVLTSSDECRSKPSPDALLKCASMLGVKAGGCVMVGDSVVDVRAGKYAGMRTVGVLSGIYSCVELGTENPDLILENVCLLPDFLDLLVK